MKNTLGVGVYTQGSSVSNVRKFGATIYFVASFFAFSFASSVIFTIPIVVHAQTVSSQLVWGDVTRDYFTGAILTSDQLYMTEGGVYPVPLQTSKSVYVQGPNNSFGFNGMLYFIPDVSSGARTFVGTFGSGAIRKLSWDHPGRYEFDVYTIPAPIFGASIWQKIRTIVLGGTAYAQSLDTFVETIHFTVSDEAALPQNSNVLFLPGIEASRLYDTDGTDHQLWEPNGDAYVHDLLLHQDGTSIRSDVFTRDILDEAYVSDIGPNIYKTFIATMNTLKSAGKIHDWSAVPYDWRLSLDQLLRSGTQTGQNISYLAATDTPYIEQTLRRLAASSRTGKVTIIAHSNGGLVAKALMQKLGATTTAALVDKVIFVAVPQVGTPSAVAALLHGYDQGISFKVSDSAMRELGNHSPAAYNLLPSNNYFTYVDDPVATFDASKVPDWASRYGTTIHSQTALHTLLTGSYGRVLASSHDTIDPVSLDDTLLTQAEQLHASLDVWTPPRGVQLIQIAGWGIPTTLAGIDYSKGTNPVCLPTGLCTSTKPLAFSARTTIDGDGTVAVPSALWVSASAGALNYWVDLKQYNKDNPFQSALSITQFKHSRILEAQPTLSFFDNILTNSALVLNKYISMQAPSNNESRLRFSLHSPLTLNLYDDQGRHTGISTTTGEVEEQIPGTYYMAFGDVKYVFTDTSSSAHIIMNGYAPGTFTFNVDQYMGDALTASTTFQDIPTSPTTQVSLTAASDIATLSSMNIDKNGDGVIDASIAPKLGGIATLDTTPPELRITFATSTNTLVFVGTDYMGTTTLSSTTSYPTLKKGQKEYRGIATTTVTARDASGNTTELVYTEQLPSPILRDTISLQAVVYNGATTTFTSTSVSYKWRLNTNGTYNLFAANIHTATSSLESHYRPRKDKTIIMTKSQDLDDSDSDDDADVRPTKVVLPYMVVPYMRIDKRLIIGY